MHLHSFPIYLGCCLANVPRTRTLCCPSSLAGDTGAPFKSPLCNCSLVLLYILLLRYIDIKYFFNMMGWILNCIQFYFFSRLNEHQCFKQSLKSQTSFCSLSHAKLCKTCASSWLGKGPIMSKEDTELQWHLIPSHTISSFYENIHQNTKNSSECYNV